MLFIIHSQINAQYGNAILSIDSPNPIAGDYSGSLALTRGTFADFTGIRKEVDTKHFSKVRLGVMGSPTDVNNNSNILPGAFMLDQNYPNPFNPSTTISFSLPENGHVSLAIYDVLGNEVVQLENGYKSAGTYSYSFDASKLTSGIYFYRIRSRRFVETKKMQLIK